MLRFTLSSCKERIQAVLSIRNVLESVLPLSRERLLRDLEAACKVDDKGAEVANYRCMTWEQVLELANDPLITFGRIP